jgi:hypothetical protein
MEEKTCPDPATYENLDMIISKTDNGQCCMMEKPKDGKLIREADGLINHAGRCISDVNSVGIRVSGEQNEMFGLIHS